MLTMSIHHPRRTRTWRRLACKTQHVNARRAAIAMLFSFSSPAALHARSTHLQHDACVRAYACNNPTLFRWTQIDTGQSGPASKSRKKAWFPSRCIHYYTTAHPSFPPLSISLSLSASKPSTTSPPPQVETKIIRSKPIQCNNARPSINIVPVLSISASRCLDRFLTVKCFRSTWM